MEEKRRGREEKIDHEEGAGGEGEEERREGEGKDASPHPLYIITVENK